MVVMAPKDEAELRDMLFTAVQYKDGPVALRYPRGDASGVKMNEGFEIIPVGKSELLRSGKDVALLAVGNMVGYAIEAAEKLFVDGIDCEVINMRFIKPLDAQVLEKVAKKYDKLVTLEENSIIGGFGSGVLEYFNDKSYKNDILRIGLPDEYIEHGTQGELHKIIEIDPEGITKKVKKFLKMSGGNKEAKAG
jgi:1-deoxy-D-xylulose-5-phosphate synthase